MDEDIVQELGDPLAGEVVVAQPGDSSDSEQKDAPDPRIELLEQELAGAKESMLRALADLQNFRRRSTSELDRARNSALSEIAMRLVPIADNFERTVLAAEEGASRESLIEGVKIVSRQLRDALEELRVARFSALGKEFDPSRHEAISMEHHALPAGTVFEEVESGFTIGKELLKPSKVKVSKGPRE